MENGHTASRYVAVCRRDAVKRGDRVKAIVLSAVNGVIKERWLLIGVHSLGVWYYT